MSANNVCPSQYTRSKTTRLATVWYNWAWHHAVPLLVHLNTSYPVWGKYSAQSARFDSIRPSPPLERERAWECCRIIVPKEVGLTWLRGGREKDGHLTAVKTVEQAPLHRCSPKQRKIADGNFRRVCRIGCIWTAPTDWNLVILTRVRWMACKNRWVTWQYKTGH